MWPASHSLLGGPRPGPTPHPRVPGRARYHLVSRSSMKSNRRAGAAAIAGAATAALLATGLVTPAAHAAGATMQSTAARQTTAHKQAANAIADHQKVLR